MGIVIEVKDLRKTFKTHKREAGFGNAVKSLFKREYVITDALKGISFTIEEGEVVGFIGPNGAGKSTTIKALSGILYPSGGEVNVLGFIPWKDRISYVSNIGVVFGQKSQLWWDLPALDSFYLNKFIYKIPEREFKERLSFLLKYLSLEELAKKPVRDLSLGERMKCQLVAALLHRPRLVFLDEPSIGLDAISKNLFRDFIIAENKKYGTTFIITTHDMQEIERLCKRVIIINNGLIVYDGDLATIKKKFLNKKLVDVILEEKGKRFSFPGAKLLETEDYRFRVELDTEKASVKSLVNHILKSYDVEDINIADPDIEEIIRKIYGGRT
jgi:ABC-2 type transport system ATP-binding protein